MGADVPAVQEPVAPWPLVPECFQTHKPGHSCAQHDGSHDHVFLAWVEAPKAGGGGTSVVSGWSGPGLPVRCTVCGARKCDIPSCSLIRHHGNDHVPY